MQNYSGQPANFYNNGTPTQQWVQQQQPPPLGASPSTDTGTQMDPYGQGGMPGQGQQYGQQGPQYGQQGQQYGQQGQQYGQQGQQYGQQGQQGQQQGGQGYGGGYDQNGAGPNNPQGIMRGGPPRPSWQNQNGNAPYDQSNENNPYDQSNGNNPPNQSNRNGNQIVITSSAMALALSLGGAGGGGVGGGSSSGGSNGQCPVGGGCVQMDYGPPPCCTPPRCPSPCCPTPRCPPPCCTPPRCPPPYCPTPSCCPRPKKQCCRPVCGTPANMCGVCNIRPVVMRPRCRRPRCCSTNNNSCCSTNNNSCCDSGTGYMQNALALAQVAAAAISSAGQNQGQNYSNPPFLLVEQRPQVSRRSFSMPVGGGGSCCPTTPVREPCCPATPVRESCFPPIVVNMPPAQPPGLKKVSLANSGKSSGSGSGSGSDDGSDDESDTS